MQEDDTPKDEVEAELLYGKLLNEQTDKIEVSTSGPVEKTFVVGLPNACEVFMRPPWEGADYIQVR